MLEFKIKFINIVNNYKKYYQFISKIEDAFDTVVTQFYEFPQSVFDLLEEESQISWNDYIWKLIYSDDMDDTLRAYQLIEKLQDMDAKDIDCEGRVGNFRNILFDEMIKQKIDLGIALDICYNKLTTEQCDNYIYQISMPLDQICEKLVKEYCQEIIKNE